jgi:hypothetical protein
MFTLRRRSVPTEIALVLSVVVATPAASQGAPRQTPVAIVVPKNPTPVVANGSRVLVYELHVTNFGTRPLVLRRVEVFGQHGARLLTLQDSTLRRSVRVLGDTAMGAAMAMTTDHPPRIPVGERAIVFMWIDMPLEAPVPRALRHRLIFATSDTSATPNAESSIDSIMVPVLREPVVGLRTPLPPGVWLAGNGPRNDSDHRRSITPLNGKARIAQRFAIDWVLIGPNGNTWHDNRDKNEDYWGFGQPIRSVASGEVTEAVDSIADNIPHAPLPPVTLANIAGNHVIVRIGPDRYVMFAHLEHGSVRVHPGQHVAAGQILGALGNSGQTTGPHVHFQVMDASSPLAAEGIPFVFDHFTFLGFGRDYEPDKHPTSPRTREMPLGDAVLRFP